MSLDMQSLMGAIASRRAVDPFDVDDAKDVPEDGEIKQKKDTMQLPVGYGAGDCLKKFLGSSEFSDVVFIVSKDKDGKEKERIGAHKVILATRSPVFEAMLYPAFPQQALQEKEKEKEDDKAAEKAAARRRKGQVEIEIHGIKASTFRALLEGVYSDKPPLSPQNISELSRAAKKYQLSGVRQACETFLKKGIKVDNCLEWFSKAESKSAERRAALCIIEDKCPKVIKSDEWLTLKADDLAEIAQSNLLAVEEDQFWEAVLHWADAEIARQELKSTPENKKTVLKHVLPYIRFPTMDMEQVVERVAPTKLVPPDHLLAIYSYIGSKGSKPEFHLHYSCIPRSPRRPEAFFTWDRTRVNARLVVQEEGLVLVSNDSSGQWYCAHGGSEFKMKSGIYEWEITLVQYNTQNSYNVVVGVVPATVTKEVVVAQNQPIGYTSQLGWSFITGQGQLATGSSAFGSFGVNVAAQCKQGDRVGMRLDTNKGTLAFFRNGKDIGAVHRGITGSVRPAISLTYPQRVRLGFRPKLPKAS